MNRAIQVELNRQERKALIDMATQDMRTPWAQVRYLVAQEAKRRGLLADLPDPPRMNEGHAVTLDKSGAPFGIQS